MINQTVAGIPVELIDAPQNLTIPCEACFGKEAEFALGAIDHQLVCETCLNWGDTRRWWHLEPRQSI